MNIRPVHVDGAIFVAIAIFGYFGTSLGSDDAAKWIDAKTLWFARNGTTAIAGGLLALKMYRSQAYSKDRKEQESGLTEDGHPVDVAK